MQTTNHRLLALDIFRGITIAGMILVNNPANWDYKYAPLQHASWHGLTPTDLIFPFFMFIMGISTYISLKKYDFKRSRTVVWKIIKRSLLIFVIGVGTYWAWYSSIYQKFSSDHVLILGVLQRLAICYGVAALVAISMKHKHIPWLIAGLLISYLCLLLFGSGFEHNESNILSIVDRAVLSPHVYMDSNGIAPEGLLSTIPGIAHVLIGFYCGKLMMEVKDINEKIEHLFIVGTILAFSGFLLSYGCPINKNIWSPTFVIVTCGLASCFLALMIWIIDVKEKKRWSRFFEPFGVNPLFLYVMGALFDILFDNIRLPFGGNSTNLKNFVYGELFQPLLGDYLGSLAYALLFVSLVWVVGYVLYKRKIYIKI